MAKPLTVALLSATGGVGRSVTCYLLAARFAAVCRTVVLDDAPELASPWDGWLARPGAVSLPSDGRPSAQQLYAAAGTVSTGGDADFTVIPGPRANHAGGLRTVDQAQQLLRTIHPRVALVDTTTPLLTALAGAARGRAGSLGWAKARSVVPVLCVPASAKGVADALTTVTTLEQQDICAEHLQVAVIGLAASDVPRRVLAGLTLLEPRVAGVVRVPHDSWLRAISRPCQARESSRLHKAIDELAVRLSMQATQLDVDAN